MILGLFLIVLGGTCPLAPLDPRLGREGMGSGEREAGRGEREGGERKGGEREGGNLPRVQHLTHLHGENYC